MYIKSSLQNNKAYQIKEGEMPKFEGTLDELIRLNNEGYIKPVFKDNAFIGLSYEDEDWQGNKAKEAQDQYEFYKAYMFKPVAKWLTLLYKIKELKQDLYNNYYLEDAELDVVQDLFNDIIEDLSNKETAKEYAIKTPAGELKDNYLFDAQETISNYEYLSQEELLKAIKKYLNITYGYCLARNTNMQVRLIQNDEGVDYIKVENVVWGRKLTQSELQARKAKYNANL